MKKFSLLWIDDEIDQLKSHLIFLENRNYKVRTCVSGKDALNILSAEAFDVILLDENMPGLSGLETLAEISRTFSNIPVVMITRNEEEYIMEEAIGSKIADYLIKPVNPNQILLTLKKILDQTRIVSEKTTSSYQQEFRAIALSLFEAKTPDDWIEIYKRLLFWELKLDDIEDPAVLEILEAQKAEANQAFGKFIEQNYANWINGEDAPISSHTVFKTAILPQIQKKKTLLLIIDNLRFDQWLAIEESINPIFRKTIESAYFSILPTATQYSRNAIFSGLTPLEMFRQYPEYWRHDHEPEGKNQFESEFLNIQLDRLNAGLTYEYHKIANAKQGKQLMNALRTGLNSDFMAVVYNFVDMLSHARTEMEVIKELASSDRAYRSLTKSWFSNSSLLDIIQEARNQGLRLIITTDHGTINVNQPSKVIGDRDTSLNLRYKTGKSLAFEKKDAITCARPEDWQLPSVHLNSTFIFARNNLFLAYPNNYNHYANLYRNTYQHGGISMEEMIVPFLVFEPR